MKLTDEKVAKALGWTSMLPGCWYPPHHQQHTHEPTPLPRFTTSLDAIVAEVEARGLTGGVTFKGGPKPCHAWVNKNVEPPQGEGNEATPPLALCAALLAYLKEAKP